MWEKESTSLDTSLVKLVHFFWSSVELCAKQSFLSITIGDNM